MASSAKQQKLDGFFIKKQTNNGINTDLTQTVPTISDTNEEGPNEEVENEKIMKSFQTKWLKEHHWLRYDEEKNMMFCSICLDYNKDNAMTKGCNNFRTSTLTRHLKHKDHTSAVSAPKQAADFKEATNKVLNDEEKAIILAMKCVYFLAKESVPLSKYPNFIAFLKFVETPHVDRLSVDQNTSYESYNSATDLLSSVVATIDKKSTDKLQDSPVITIMTDESTDIVVHHKLCISARLVDPITLKPSTIFLSNIRLHDAKGKSIFDAIKSHLDSRHVKITKVMGLGTDGASTMTGKKEGLTGHFLRENPHLMNTHCAAHRLALCSEQAAKSIPVMTDFQRTLESIFYHFKKSPQKVDQMEAIQKLFDEPAVKYREVHQVRWLSFYEALDGVYRTLGSLLSYLDNQAATQNDTAAKGIKKKVAQALFISIVYAMMDILQPIMRLSLVFQKKDLDIGVVPVPLWKKFIIQVNVKECLRCLEEIRDDVNPLEKPTYLSKLKEDLVDGKFKGDWTVAKMKHASEFKNVKTNFINAVITNIEHRFPNSEFLQAFASLGMRPLSFVSESEISDWGNESIQRLADFYGSEQQHVYKDPNTKETQIFKSSPILDRIATMTEWRMAKMTVKAQFYPTHSMVALWEVLATHHKEDFPNLIKLAMLAITHPIHTADCERAFSGQNRITTALRNRLSPEHCDDLMKVLIEGPDLKTFDFVACLNEWRKQKMRRIFCRTKKE